jgi:hypothetical protein
MGQRYDAVTVAALKEGMKKYTFFTKTNASNSRFALKVASANW